MCNAWNHPPNCTCGWGGDGHLGKRVEGNQYKYESSNVSFYTYSFESYIYPNAKCPVCGMSVFFYKSPFGGRVFFDELGPPWPKHPCTDNTKNIYKNPLPNYNYVYTEYKWQKNGWTPVVVENIANKSAYAFLIVRLDRQSNRQHIEAMIYGYYADILVKKDILTFAKRSNQTTLILAGFDIDKDDKFEIELNYPEYNLDSFFENNISIF